MKSVSAKKESPASLKAPKRSQSNINDLSAYLVERESQRQSLVHSLKGKFCNMKFTSEDLIKQRRAETLLEGR